MMSNVDIIVDIINRVGFPVFVSMWFMFRTEKIISKNTEALTALIEVINDKS